MKNNIIKINGKESYEVLKVVERLMNEEITWTRFDYKQAWFSNRLYVLDGTYRLLKSYSTIVAVVDITNNKFYELGKWSATTSKQVTQYHDTYYSECQRYLLVE